MIVRLWLLVVLVLAVTAPGGRAEEAILDFASRVEVAPNGDYLVTETIRVRAEGREIRRGIYRDIPTTFENADGRTVHVDFELLSASRDGNTEQTRIETANNAIRIYLGYPDVFLATGEHTYVLSYRTDRQLRRFDDHDEVYWNATGTEWIFPILKASALVRLPEAARALETTAYTGPYGSRAQDYRSTLLDGGREVLFETTRPLGPREGLSVVVSLPKGAVASPSNTQTWAWFMRDNLATIIAMLGAIGVFLYFFLTWSRVGRDPPKETMVPRWEPPEGVSPALSHYIWNRGLRGSGFPALSSAAISLAVQGYLILDDIGRTLTLRRTEKAVNAWDLPVGEAAILRRLGGYGSRFAIARDNGEEVSSLGVAFRRAMEKEHRSVYYRHNHGLLLLGVAASAVIFVAVLIFGNLTEGALGVLLPAMVAGGIMIAVAVSLAKRSGSGLWGKIRIAFIGFFIANGIFNFGLSVFGEIVSAVGDPYLVGALGALVMTNALFYFLLGAPTPIGQTRTAEIEGLRRYLTVAEADRMNMAGAPQMSPQHYETLLPYAVALGVEKPWSDAFQSWLATAAVASSGVGYSPGWYHGDSSQGFGDRMSDLGTSLSKSFTSALPAQSSSSSGFSSGGGFSGGGGGGGGGGGW